MDDKNKTSEDDTNFKKILDESIVWPSVYIFKFIVPRAGLAELTKIFAGEFPSLRNSKNGRYVGFTVEREMVSSEAVLQIYRQASTIKGIIALWRWDGKRGCGLRQDVEGNENPGKLYNSFFRLPCPCSTLI